MRTLQQDINTANTLINKIHRNNRNKKYTKTITTKFINNLNFGLRISILKTTNNICLCHSLRYRPYGKNSIDFYPTKNNKLSCNNINGLNLLYKTMKANKKYRQKRDKIKGRNTRS